MIFNKKYTLLIIGGGPIGLACAIEAQKSGISYTIIEKGCLVNSLFNYPKNMTFFSTAERLEIGNVPFVSNNAKPTRAEALEYYRRVATTCNLKIQLFENVKEIEKISNTQNQDGANYLVTTLAQTYTAKYIVIATGFYDIPYKLGVAGENLPKVTHYYNDPHFYAMQNVLVVGAQNSAVDAALETWRKGARVTMVVRKEEIGKRVKYWVRPDIINRIENGEIKAYFNATVKEIKEKEVVIATPQGDISIANDWVIALTGYQPNLTFLQKIGIQLSPDEILKPELNEETQETNCKNIYLAGVICGGMNTHRLFIENSREHAVKIITDIKTKEGL